MINDPMANPAYLNVDRGEVLWKTRAAPTTSRWRAAISARGRQARGRLCQAAALFRGCRPGHGSRAAAAVVHAEDPGARHQGRARAPFGSPGAHSDMEDLVAFIANKSSGMKIAAAADASQGEGDATRSARRCSTGAAASVDFSCATCHARGRQAHPAAGAAQPVQARQGRPGNDGHRGRPTVFRRASAHHAAPALGLLSADAHAGARICSPTASRRSRSI